MELEYDFPGMDVLERPRYFSGQLLTPEDLIAEQNYFREKMRRHNLFLHGWGPVCGLEVIADPVDGKPWQIKIESGYAIGPYGDEIYIPKAISFNLADCGSSDPDPCTPGDLQEHNELEYSKVYVAIRYTECLTHPVKAGLDGCGCNEDACEYIRIREGFQVECLRDLPRSHIRQSQIDICELEKRNEILPCMEQFTDPWVVLAQVELFSTTTKLQKSHIHPEYRHPLYATAILQNTLRKCCCEQGQNQQGGGQQ